MGALNLYRIPCSSVRTRTCGKRHHRGISATEVHVTIRMASHNLRTLFKIQGS